MTPSQRRGGLFVILAGVIAWSIILYLTPQAAPQVSVAVHRKVSAAQAGQAPKARNDVVALPAASRLDGETITDLFLSQSWAPKLPPKPNLAQPQVPQMPPLPFAYIGRWQAPDKTDFYYLAAGEHIQSVRAGQTLDGNWQLAAADDQNLTFIYLPLKQSRSLRMGERHAQNASPVLVAPARE